ncbi:hypothetical protein Trydic_g14556 [Trypoxylus dichotomus]
MKRFLNKYFGDFLHSNLPTHHPTSQNYTLHPTSAPRNCIELAVVSKTSATNEIPLPQRSSSLKTVFSVFSGQFPAANVTQTTARRRNENINRSMKGDTARQLAGIERNKWGLASRSGRGVKS